MKTETSNPYAVSARGHIGLRGELPAHWVRNACLTAACTLPFLIVMRGTWLLAWIVLGHMPRPMLDDPKFISPLVGVVYGFAYDTCFFWLVAGFLATCLSVMVLRHHLLNLAIGLLSWFVALVLVGGMMEWFLD